MSKNSQTPSLQITINLSFSFKTVWSISGIDITPNFIIYWKNLPAFAAIVSPKLRLIANPGNYSFFNHTLYGPIYPSEYLNYSTLPPDYKILYFSKGFSGF